MTKKYEVKVAKREIPWCKKNEITEGVTLRGESQNLELLSSHDSIEDAFKVLSNYKTDITRLSGGAGTYYLIEEYLIEEVEYDEDGEWQNGNVIEMSTMPSYNFD